LLDVDDHCQNKKIIKLLNFKNSKILICFETEIILFDLASEKKLNEINISHQLSKMIDSCLDRMMECLIISTDSPRNAILIWDLVQLKLSWHPEWTWYASYHSNF